MEKITLNEMAGYGVGALLLYATLSASKVDAFIASSQRRSLGMCKRCGDLKVIACSNCKGTGSVKDGNFLSNMMDDLFEAIGDDPRSNTKPCIKCRSKGSTPCPECSIKS